MQIAFTALLVLLSASMVSFVVMGVLQMRRTRALAGEAHRSRLRFSADDPFDVPLRYAGLALVRCGHSPRASNVTYGRVAGCPIRAFDFRYEVGHGMRRSARHYSVIVIETGLSLPGVTMWHEQDAQAAPLAVRVASTRLGCWFCLGSEALAAALGGACEPMAPDGVSVQTHGSVLMLCMPVRRRRQHYTDYLENVREVLAALRTACASRADLQNRAGEFGRIRSLKTPPGRDKRD